MSAVRARAPKAPTLPLHAAGHSAGCACENCMALVALALPPVTEAPVLAPAPARDPLEDEPGLSKDEKAALKVVGDHQDYFAADGCRLPGATTVLGGLDKPALVPWANKLGLRGISSANYTDFAAGVGTLAHHLVETHLSGQPIADLSALRPSLVQMARAAYDGFAEWVRKHEMESVLAEVPLVSEAHRFGGKVDWYGRMDGIPTLLDVKTSKSVWDEHRWQVSAYRELLREHGHEVGRVLILHLPRNGDPLTVHPVPEAELAAGWEVFAAALDVYNQRREFAATRRAS